jgi:hypothetical protein
MGKITTAIDIDIEAIEDICSCPYLGEDKNIEGPSIACVLFNVHLDEKVGKKIFRCEACKDAEEKYKCLKEK